MTSACRGWSRRLNGSMVTRSVVSLCSVPFHEIGPSRLTSASYARGQSSSVPSSNPMTCSTVDLQAAEASAEAWQVMGELGAPRRPVVRDVVTPQVELAADAPLAEQVGHLPGGVQRAGRVLPLALAADQQHGQLPAQPVEVVAVQVGHVVDRVVEVGLLAALAPAAP